MKSRSSLQDGVSIAPRRTLLLLVVACAAVNASSAQDAVNSASSRDSRALAVLQQAVQAAGGLQAIDAMQSYAGSGRIVLHRSEEGTGGQMTIKGRGVQDFRLDISLPDGSDESWFVKGWNGFKKEGDGSLRPLSYPELLNIQSWCLPSAQLANAIRDSQITVSFLGKTIREGRSSYGIGIRPPSASHQRQTDSRLAEKDFYIDAQTFRILEVEDRSYGRDNLSRSIPRHVIFSDYRSVEGAFFPFSIVEQVGKKRTLMEIYFQDLSIDSSLADHDFTP